MKGFMGRPGDPGPRGDQGSTGDLVSDYTYVS